MAEQLLHIKVFSVGLPTTLIAVALAVTAAQAQTPAALMYDAKNGSIAFGASDLKTALTANGHTVTVLPPGDPAQAKQSVRIILTTEGVKLPGHSSGNCTRESPGKHALKRNQP